MENVIHGGSFPKRYTIGEELMNAITHGLGAMLAAAATTLLVAASALQGDPYKLGASIAYGFSLMELYLMSTVYHAVQSPRAKEVLRVFDHCSIFLLIAGSYTPFALVTLREAGGWLIFFGIWGAALVGIALNAVSLRRFEKLSMACYVAMGWAIVLKLGTLVELLPAAGMGLLVAGGLCYTGGLLFYAVHKPYMHSVWHLFVLGGSVCHFLCIWLYVVLPA